MCNFFEDDAVMTRFCNSALEKVVRKPFRSPIGAQQTDNPSAGVGGAIQHVSKSTVSFTYPSGSMEIASCPSIFHRLISFSTYVRGGWRT